MLASILHLHKSSAPPRFSSARWRTRHHPWSVINLHSASEPDSVRNERINLLKSPVFALSPPFCSLILFWSHKFVTLTLGPCAALLSWNEHCFFRSWVQPDAKRQRRKQPDLFGSWPSLFPSAAAVPRLLEGTLDQLQRRDSHGSFGLKHSCVV